MRIEVFAWRGRRKTRRYGESPLGIQSDNHSGIIPPTRNCVKVGIPAGDPGVAGCVQRAIMSAMGRRALVSRFCDGYILTGGRSSRMGQDKALLEVNGKPLVKTVAGHVRRVLDEVTLVGSKERYQSLGFPVIEDIHPGLGPIAGIHAALRHSHKPLVLVVGCDMPFLNAEFLEKLVQVAAVADAEVTVAESVEYGVESLCAVYNQTTLPLIEDAIHNRELKVALLFDKVHVRKLSADEYRPFNPQGVLFSNINTPQDFDMARRRFESMAR